MQHLNSHLALATTTLPFLFTLNLLAAEEPIGGLIIAPGPQSRPSSFVQFEIPDDWDSKPRIARNSDGDLVPLQIDDDGLGWMRVGPLAANEKQKFQIYSGTSKEPPPVGMAAHRVGSTIEFWQGKKRVLNYQAEPGDFPRNDIKKSYRRGGYIHPIWSPDGNVVTDDFPANHVHHHGVWFPWTKTRFEEREPDFWNMGLGSGRVEFVQVERYFGGPVFASLTTKHKFVDLLAEGGKTALNEVWTVRVYSLSVGSKFHVIDLESVQTCATDSPLILPEYRYGGLGFRGHGDWDGAENAYFLTSNGETDRVRGHATRADWCYIGGDAVGKRTGIVIMGHPDNFRAPQPMRLHPTEPFFCFAPQQAGDMSIQPGKRYVSKYRFLVIDGIPDPELIDDHWLDYSTPMTIHAQ